MATLFLQKVIPPVGKLLPKTVLELLTCIEQYMLVKSSSTTTGLVETVVSEDPPVDTSVLWTQIDGNGFPLGTFKFNDGEWRSVTYTKGITIQLYVGPAVIAHPHWRICDPDVVGAAIVNGVTIPQFSNRMTVAAAPGKTYSMGDTGGADSKSLVEAEGPQHVHQKGTLAGLAEKGIKNHHDHKITRGASTTGPNIIDQGSSGAVTAQDSTVPGDAAAQHEHDVTITGETASSGAGQAFDIRSQWYALGYAIYVGNGV